MVPTVFDKTQARARKSIFCFKSYKNVVLNHLELIRDKLKNLFVAENSGLKWGTFQKWDRFYYSNYSFRKSGGQNMFDGTLMRSMVPKALIFLITFKMSIYRFLYICILLTICKILPTQLTDFFYVKGGLCTTCYPGVN